MKKRILFPAALGIFGILFGAIALVQSDENEPSKKIEKQVEVKVLGDVAAENVTIDGDQIIVKLPNGQTEVIDLKNLPKQELDRVDIDEDGDADVQVQGKAIIVGPDGKVQEFDLTEKDLKGGLDLPPPFGDAKAWLKRFQGNLPPGHLPDPIRPSPASKYMIGVALGPTSKTLQVQLELETPGIAVLNVLPDSPAAKAGIQPHDVLIAAGDKPLENMGDLVSAVEQAGSMEAELTIKLIRKGEASEVKVTPTTRPESTFQSSSNRNIDLPQELYDKTLRKHFENLHDLDRLRSLRQELLHPEADVEFNVHRGTINHRELLEAIESLEQRIEKLEAESGAN